MRIAVLGAIGVVDASASVPSGEIARRVLAVLVAEANRPVHPDRLTDLVWAGQRRSGGNSLQAHISRWRKVLGAHRITFSPAGYTLVVGPLELDALEFEDLARAAHKARFEQDLPSALDTCDRAIALWSGEAFGGLADDDCIRPRKAELDAGLDSLRLARLEMWCETEAYDAVIAEATQIIETDRWNAPVHRVLARAHYGREDQVAALQVLGELEAALRTELGLDLGPASQLLREQILRQEPALDSAAPLAAATAGGHPPRLTGRIENLPDTTRRLLYAAALSEIAIDTAHLGRALGLDGPTIADALAPAIRSGIVVRTDMDLRFTNAGVQETVAGLVPAGAALDLHRRLGEELAKGPMPEDARRRAARHLASAASMSAATAARAVVLDRDLTSSAMTRAQYGDAVHHARRALASAAHLDHGEESVDIPTLHFAWAEALHRNGELDSAIAAYQGAAAHLNIDAELLARCALAHEECSFHARRHRTGPRDPSVELLERALDATDPLDLKRIELLASLAQALSFSGIGDRAVDLAYRAVSAARRAADPETLARTLLRAVAVHDPATEATTRLRSAHEAAEICRTADADELEVEALVARVPELLRLARWEDAELAVSRVEHLVDIHDNVLHRCKVPMWRAALALAAERYAEAAVLIEDFREVGLADGYDDTDRIHGFQSILLALGRGCPEEAAEITARFSHDVAFEPWRATALLVAHAQDDLPSIEQILVPWSARRFAMSRPFAAVQVFCGCLVAPAVAKHGDHVARTRLAEVIRVGVGQQQVLGAGAAILPDPDELLMLLD